MLGLQIDVTGTRRMASYRWWEEGELRDLCSTVGLQGFQRERRWRFIMFAARKPMPGQGRQQDAL